MKRRCTATVKATGERCKLPPLRGSVVCWKHGAGAPQVRAAAERREAESAVLAAYERHSTNGDRPADVSAALLALVAEVRRWAEFTGARVEALTAADWRPDDPRAAAELALYERSLDRAHRLLADVARLGLEARLARVTESQVIQLARTIRAVLGDLNGLLCHDCRVVVAESVPRIVPGHIRRLGA
jgi:hypothetical protein